MSNWVVFDEFLNYLAKKVIDFSADTFKVILSNTAPVKADNKVYADISANELANGHGYTTGGFTLTGVSYTETGASTGIWQFTVSNFSWTASGASVGPARYAVIYDDTPAGTPTDPLVAYLDMGSQTIADGDTLQITISANGVVRINAS